LTCQNPQNLAGIKRWALLSLILLCLSWRLALPINLTCIDLGRHIKNGELLVHGAWDVLYQNHYSYTNPGYPFINHHWFFGVLCYLAWHFLGFTGISFAVIILRLVTFWIFFKLAQRFSSFFIACAFSLLSFPLIASRIDIRPELFSTLFCGLYWWLIESYKQGRLTSGRSKFWAIVLQIIWVNTHIFFIMGPILIIFFWVQAKAEDRKQESRDLKHILWWVFAACLFNPSGINGALLPFSLLRGFHTSLIENLPLFAVVTVASHSLWRSCMISIEALMICWVFLLQYRQIRNNIAKLLLVILISTGVLFVNRLIAIFGHFWIPLVAYAFAGWTEVWPDTFRKTANAVLIVLGVLVALTVSVDWGQQLGFGLDPKVNDSAAFLKQPELSGPVFNNYPIGGYLIYELSPSNKLFVDNRAEAYPKDFFDHTLNPAIQEKNNWLMLDEKYHFNVICFYISWLNDYEENFIFDRMSDPRWAPVFIDDHVFIFLRRDGKNSGLIRRYPCNTTKVMKRLKGLLHAQF